MRLRKDDCGTIVPWHRDEQSVFSSSAELARVSLIFPRDRNLDIKREPPKKGKRVAYIGDAVVALIGITVALSRLEAAPPTVERGSLWIDTVRRGETVRQVRGPGTLQPAQIRFVSTVTAGRVERVLVRPGAPVTAGTVLVELSNPDVQLEALSAEQQLNGAEAGLVTLQTNLETARLNQEGVVTSTRSEYNDAKRNADVANGLDTLLSKNDVGKARDTGAELGLEQCLRGDAIRTVDTMFPSGAGRWQLRRTTFRQNGQPHQLVVLSDLSKALREEERLAWQRIIRVLGHEINNSLAPIKSIAESLRALVDAPVRDEESEEDVRQGLSVISNRAGSLGRFMTSYAILARLPGPRHSTVEVPTWVRRTAKLETRVHVEVQNAQAIDIVGDSDQLDQLLINLVRNAADASLETGGGVAVGWQEHGAWLHLWVRDDGYGIADSSNLFVPFFTTKPEGSGIGLALSRQIAEAHGGTLTLENRADVRGCEAVLRLPIG